MKNNTQAQKLKFRILSCSGEDEGYPSTELYTTTPNSKGWQSPRFCDYPQEMIIQFMGPVQLQQLQFLSHQSKISTKIDIYIHLQDPNKPAQNIAIEDVKFKKLGYMSLDNNERSAFQARELKYVYLDNKCQYLKLAFHKCHVNKYNLFNQVGLIALGIFGTPVMNLPQQNNQLQQQDQNVPGLQYLEYETQFDPQTLQQLKDLQISKDNAIRNEDFQEAKRIKEIMEKLKQVGTQLQFLEERKQIAINNEDFDSAQIIKMEIDKLRGIINPQKFSTKSDKNSQYSNENPPQRFSQQSSQQQPSQNHQKNLQNFQQAQYEEEETMLQSQTQFNQIQPSSSRDNRSKAPKTPQSEINTYQMQPQKNIINVDDMQLPAQMNQLDQMSLEEKQELQFREMQKKSKKQTQEPVNQKKSFQEQKIQYDVQQSQIDKMESQLPAQRNKLNQMSLEEQQEQLFKEMNNRKKGGPSQEQQRQINNDVEPLDELSPSDAKKAEPILPVTGEELCKRIFNKSWQIKDEGIKQLEQELQNPVSINANDVQSVNAAVLAVVHYTIQDKVAQVSISSLGLLITLLEQYQMKKSSNRADIITFIDSILNQLVERIGDNHSRIREIAEQSFIELSKSQAIGCVQTSQVLLKAPIKGKLAGVRHLQARLQALSSLVQEFGINGNGVALEPCVTFALKQLEHQNQEIRQASIELLTELYKKGGSQMRPMLVNVKSAQMEILQNQFDQISQSNNNSKTNQQAPKIEKKQQNLNIKENKSTKQEEINNNAVCEYCSKYDKNFLDGAKFDLHMWKECPMLTTCQYCSQVIEILNLNQHMLLECDKKDGMKKCPRCKEAIPVKGYKRHVEELSCIPCSNQTNVNRCPLCHLDIPGGESGFKKHILVQGCPNNERSAL